MPHLVILQGPDTDRRIDLNEGCRIVLGRSPRCDVILNDREVSRRHVEFSRRGNVITLQDLGSSNGTLVNSQPVELYELKDKDRIQVGRNLMVYDANQLRVSSSSISLRADEQSFDVFIVPELNEDEAVDDNLSQIRQVFASNDHRLAAWDDASVVATSLKEVTPQNDIADPYWQMMYRAVMQISHTEDLPELVQQILDMIFQWIQCDRACILLVDPATQQLQPAGRKDRKANVASSSLEISQTILDYVREHGEGVLTSDAVQDQRWETSASISRAGVREAICVPMPGRHGLVGVIYIDTARSAGSISMEENQELLNGEHLKLLSAIAHHAALVAEDVYNYRAKLQSERLAAMGTVIATISHHIKNILQGIEGGSFLVNDALKRADLTAVRTGWKVVEKNQNRIKSLVLDMLAYGKERRPKLSEQDMNYIVAEVVELVEANAQDQNVGLIFKPAPQPAWVFGESEALYHAILNLITNAIDSCVSKRKQTSDELYRPQVSISVAAANGFIQTVVSDNGEGLSEEQIDRLFVAFESNKGARGSGIGLAVSRKIISEHGGRISVESELDKGSQFIVQLPVDSDHENNRIASEKTMSLGD